MKRENRADRHKNMLGMPYGTAFARLRKSLMFDLAMRCGACRCHRCGLDIESVEHFSIEHKSAWENAANPRDAFFSLENIAFSHLRCNIRAASKPNKKYKDKLEYYRVNFSLYYERHGARWNKIRRERRRKKKQGVAQ